MDKPIHVNQNERFLTIVLKQFEVPSIEITNSWEYRNSFKSEMYTQEQSQNTKSSVTVWVFEKKITKNRKKLLERLHSKIEKYRIFDQELELIAIEFEEAVINVL